MVSGRRVPTASHRVMSRNIDWTSHGVSDPLGRARGGPGARGVGSLTPWLCALYRLRFQHGRQKAPPEPGASPSPPQTHSALAPSHLRARDQPRATDVRGS